MTRTARAIVLVLCAAPAAARAAAPRTAVAAFAVAESPDAVSDAAHVELALRLLVERDDSLRLLDTTEVTSPGDEDPARAALDRARTLLGEAKGSMERLETDQAIGQLEKAVADFEGAVLLAGPRDGYSAALFLLGVAHALEGRRQKAVEAFRRAAAVDAALEPDPAVHPPEVRDAAKKGREVLKAEPGTISFDSPEPGVRVFVDGSFAGVAPLATGKLVPGSHFVRAEKDGLVPWASVLEVRPRRTEKVPLELAPARQKAVFDDYLAKATGTPEGPRSLGRWLGAKKLLLVRVARDGEGVRASGSVVLVDDGREAARGAETSAGADSGQLLELGTRLGSSLLDAASKAEVARNVADVGTCSRDEDCPGGQVCDPERRACVAATPLWGHWWFWAALGGLALVGTGVAVLSGGEDAPAPEPEPSTGTVRFRF